MQSCARSILVTGGCGFIGSNFINKHWKEHEDSFIVNLDAMYYCADEDNVDILVRKSPRYVFVEGNICDADLVYHILKTYDIDIVVHFAAQSHVQDSFTDSAKYVRDNVVGTHTLLEAARKYGEVIKFIHISTDEVYGESLLSDDQKKTEQSVLCPTNPYAATKASAELLATSYHHSFKLPVIITRGNNVYGPNQYPEKLIPKFIKLLKEGKKVTIQGNGTNVRGFLHVWDVICAIDIIIEKGEIGEIYNIGSEKDDEFSVRDIAKGLILIMNKDKNKTFKYEEDYEPYIEYIEDRPFNDMRYFISNKKIKDLGWKPEVNFLDGLVDLIEDDS